MESAKVAYLLAAESDVHVLRFDRGLIGQPDSRGLLHLIPCSMQNAAERLMPRSAGVAFSTIRDVPLPVQCEALAVGRHTSHAIVQMQHVSARLALIGVQVCFWILSVYTYAFGSICATNATGQDLLARMSLSTIATPYACLQGFR